ncbi:hypothetical protein DLM75_17960 [Leptospira stimsonii]|uniref:Uncharacterized protein n=1 Tax=Leptospira stimsonii TaxID=2202203 RepID=A0A396Z136_9LEPT|nr:hypothetical protein DLM75_17960 [Leptospira stimsonii]
MNRFYLLLTLSSLSISFSPLFSGEFEGIYTVGNRECRVTPIRMAFEVICKPSNKRKIFFYQGEDKEKRIFRTDDGDSSDFFVFDDLSFQSGVFIGNDGIRRKVKKRNSFRSDQF